MRPLHDLDALRSRYPLQVVVGASLKLLRSGCGWKGCCPFHRDRTPSLSIFDNGRRWYCFGCQSHGDVFDYLQRLHGISLPEAAAMLDRGWVKTAAIPQTTHRRLDRDTRAEAVRIWRSAGLPEGTAVEKYLESRGITIAIPPTIRFARLRYKSSRASLPCLVALATTSEGKIGGIQRTFLKADGSGKADVPAPKLSLGAIREAAIRLGPAAAEMAVVEGLEDGLSLQQELGVSVWVAAGASMLPAMRFPPSVRSILIGADSDEAGRAAADRAVQAFDARGLAVRIIQPEAGFKDWNEMLTGARRR